MPVLSPPQTRLDDGAIALRPFQPSDLPAFRSATSPGGNDGNWLIVAQDDLERSLADHIGSWSTGSGLDGPALAVVHASMEAVLGVVYLIVRAEDSVEVTYGVAPAQRGQGVATRAVTLVADWLLSEGWVRVELRIDDNALASQRVADKSGFRYAGRVRTWVASAGREFDDRLYLRSA